MTSRRKCLAFSFAGLTLFAGALWFAQDYKYRHPYSPLFFSVANLAPLQTPSPSPTPVRMYRALDVGKPGVPRMDAVDRAELEAAVRRGIAKRANIWWAYTGKTDGSATAFVMVETRNPNLQHQGYYNAYTVVTDANPKCKNVMYEPADNREFATLECW